MTVAIDTRSTPIHFIPKDQVGAPRTLNVDVAALEQDLRKTVEGEVRFDAGTRGMYSQDASNYRMVPLGVVLPKRAADVVATVAACRKYGAPLLSRGGGTGIPGQSNNTAVMLDFSKYMHAVLDIDPDRKLARVQPGVVLDSLRETARKYELTFGPDPATHTRCTLGGMIGNNSCGIHSMMAGRTVDNIEELDVLLYDGTRMRVGATSPRELEQILRAGGRRGEIYGKLKEFRDKYADLIRKRVPQIPRRVSGYSVDELLPEKGFHVARALVGSESTLVTVLEATCNLVWDRPVRSLLVLGFPDIFAAADFVPEVLPSNPIGLEGVDAEFLDDMQKKGLHDPDAAKLPQGRGWLFVEYGGHNKYESDGQARELMDRLRAKGNAPEMRLYDDPELEQHLWRLREEGLGATARVPGEPENWEGWEDSAVPPLKTGAYLRDLKKLMDRYGYEGALYGHFGQGCIHTRLNFELETADGIAHYRSFVEEASDMVAAYGGSLSGEHGDGQSRGELLTRMFGEEMIQAFRDFKAIWDPDWRMNPGKLIAPFRLDENLRLGTGYNPPDPETHFKWPDDKHSFSFATLRCVGAGVCRRKSGGTMCPSYMVTLEEKHCTRGRARMLYEMLEGDPVKGGWKSEEVKESLDLCLACKGCKGDCPVQVDMATYKSEFLSHYYDGRLRPRAAYSMGLIYWWARAASLMPGVVNLVTHLPGSRTLAKLAGGIASPRSIPRFAPKTFKQWFFERPKKNVDGPRVILWPDTFNNHFHTSTAKSAVEVLEAAGFCVDVPRPALCCGRPLYDWGMLEQAKRLLHQTLNTLRDDIRAGTPFVFLEPSCCSVFRDEMYNLMPDDQDAKRLQHQSFMLSEFFEKKAPNFNIPHLKRKALVHMHCHHKSVLKKQPEEDLLKKMALDYQMPEDGCCGMAGSFGFEEGDKYDVSLKVGERALLPKVREADAETIIVADGFSCREQIEQETGRRAIHLADVMAMALRGSRPGPYPEKEFVTPDAREVGQCAVQTAVILGAVAAAATAGLWMLARRGRRAMRESGRPRT